MPTIMVGPVTTSKYGIPQQIVFWPEYYMHLVEGQVDLAVVTSWATPDL
jgi:hypothetical protein